MSIILTPGQSEVFNDLFVEKKCLNAVVRAARGWGKSFFAGTTAATAIMELLELRASVPNKNVYIIAPTYGQVTDIYYPLLEYQLGMGQYAIDSSKDAGRFWFPNNVELRLVSYEAVERLRGTGAYFIVNDEVRDWTKGGGFKDAWEGVLQPAIKTRWGKKRSVANGSKSPGRSLTISTTKGYDYLYTLNNLEESDPEWKSYHFDYTSSPFLDPEELSSIKDKVDPLTWNREYLALFEGSGNSVFYCFDRKAHVTSALPELEDWEDVHVGIDFNVGLQCSSMFVIRGGQVHYLDEFKGHPDTENLAIAIKGRYWPNFNNIGHPDYKQKTRRIFVYPDPTGKSRKTSATVGTTDLTILASHGFTVLAKNASPSIVDSVACVNKKLKTASGKVDMYFHPRCVGTIESMERTVWVDNNSDTATIDKKEGVEHHSDSVRYPMDYLFPILVGKKRSSKGFNF